MSNTMVSIQEVRAFAFLADSRPFWLTNAEIAAGAKIAGRAARAFTAKFAELGILEVARVFPRSLYRLAGKPADKAGAAHLRDLSQAAKVFDITFSLELPPCPC